MLYRNVLQYNTKAKDKLDITKDVQSVVEKYGVQDGICSIFLRGTTAAIMLNEDDRMLMADIEKLLSQLAPEEKLYQHPQNAHSHLRSMILNNSMNIPISEGRLLLGKWQSIMLWEFDVEERQRDIVVTIIGSGQN